MKQYRATVFGNRYPVIVGVKASSWHTAAHRAVEVYEQKFLGNRTKTLTIKLVQGEL